MCTCVLCADSEGVSPLKAVMVLGSECINDAEYESITNNNSPLPAIQDEVWESGCVKFKDCVGNTHPLLVQLHQLLCDLGRVEGQAQAVRVELRHQVLQHLFEWQTSSQAVLGGGGDSVFQDGAPQGVELGPHREG